jgi:hypothetical protein
VEQSCGRAEATAWDFFSTVLVSWSFCSMLTAGSFTEAIVAPTTPHCNLECEQLCRRCATANECECDSRERSLEGAEGSRGA